MMSWDLITEIFDYDFLKTHSSVVMQAINHFLKNKELYGVKISILVFLNKVSDQLIYNFDIN